VNHITKKNYLTRRFPEVWMEQCAAVEYIRNGFGQATALDYIVGDKLVVFIESLNFFPDRRADLPQFVAMIRTLFNPQELHGYFANERRRRGGPHRRRAALREAQTLLCSPTPNPQ
jgi:hypothetical protein